MLKKWRIKREIRKWARKHSFLWINYSKWYVGITSNPNLRKAQHRSGKWFKPRYWQAWNAGSLGKARSIEKAFGELGIGMQGGKVLGNVRKSTVWVYVYKV